MKTAVIYARYSSDNQTEQSIEGQLRVCEQYAKNNDILILDTYIDRAMTGTNDNRPDFQKMIKDSNSKEFQYILVYKIDRFSRNKYEIAKYKKILKDNGVKLLSAMENIPDTPEGIILESLLEGMAEYYSAELAQKVKRGMRELRLKGHFQGGYLPYGYKLKDKKLILHEEESEIVKEIFTKYANGIYVSQIVRELTLKNCLHNGKPFNLSMIYTMLGKEIYKGIYRIKDEVYTNMFPAIISEDTFNKVQTRRRLNHYGKGSSPDTTYLFRNKLICGYCGRPISAESGRTKAGKKICYYKCLGLKKYNSNCPKETLRQDYLEECLLNAIISEMEKEENIKVIIKNILDLQNDSEKMNQTLNQLIKSKNQSETLLDNIMKAVENGVINKTTNKRMIELESKIEELEKEIIIEKSKVQSKITEEEIRTYYKQALKKEPLLLINYLVNHIVLFNDRFEITFNNPSQSPVNQGFLFSKKFSKIEYFDVHSKTTCYETIKIYYFI